MKLTTFRADLLLLAAAVIWGSGFVAGFVTKGGDYKAWLIHKMGGVWIWQTELKTFTP